MLAIPREGSAFRTKITQTAPADLIGAMILGAVILYAVTSWLWLVVHQGLH